MTDLITLKQRLREAETALHRLMMGEREVKVVVDDYGETTFSQVNRLDLQTYIARLKNEIAQAEGRPKRGPLFMKF